MKKTVRVGSRDSELAVKQAQIVMDAVSESHPNIMFELIKIKTAGDKILDKRLDKIGGKGLFIKELEQALIDFDIDIAVHSYKDMPYEETEDLPIVALSERASPFDALVLPQGKRHMDKTRPIGSSSLRRVIQLKTIYQDYKTEPIRGNIITRLKKLDSGEYSALVLAMAGLERLSLHKRASRIFTPEQMVPCGSQGILAVQGRRGEDYSYLSQFHSLQSEIQSKAERRVLKTLAVNCASPVGVYAGICGKQIEICGMFSEDYERAKKAKIRGNAEDAEALGVTLANMLKDGV